MYYKKVKKIRKRSKKACTCHVHRIVEAKFGSNQHFNDEILSTIKFPTNYEPKYLYVSMNRLDLYVYLLLTR